ncbi:hypothetical protein HZB05_02920 [Candidatus Wolfebacteria bacterium]|nr:hypothetical protein [Candidatus Wolfebacteria bacterium]
MPNKEAQATQQFVDVEEIRNGVVILKGGGLRRVLMVSGVNFALKSEEEQNIIIGAYQSFLNSLDFSAQVVIHSRGLNIESYLHNFISRQETEKNDLIKEQIGEYVEFIRSFVKANVITEKTFFVVVPYDPVEIPAGGTKILESVPFFGKKKNQQEEVKSLEEKIVQLDQRTDQVINGLSGVGLRIVALNNEELIELFYNLYNPQAVEKKELGIAKEQ